MLDRPTPLAASTDFPNSPTLGQIFGNWIWDGAKWKSAPVETAIQDIPHCGRLGIVGTASPATNLQFLPYKGDLISINGVLFQIPAGGLQAAYNNASIDGVAGQTLAVATVYYVYVFSHSGTLTIDFSKTGYAQASNGLAVKATDPTRTLVGMANTGGNGEFYDNPIYRYTRSWFNRGLLVSYAFGNNTNFAGSTQIAGMVALCFAGEEVAMWGGWYGTSPAQNLYFSLSTAPQGIGSGNIGLTSTADGMYRSTSLWFGYTVAADGPQTLAMYAYGQSGIASTSSYPWIAAAAR